MKLVTRPLFLLLLIILAAGIYRGILLYTHEGFLGVDGGAYFLSRNAVLGNEPTSQGFARPPLAPGWLLVPFTSLWGDDIGFKIWSLVSSLLPIPAVFLFGTRILGNRGALIGALFIAFCPFQSEMFVTGALPLIGFSPARSVVGPLLSRRRRAVTTAQTPRPSSFDFIYCADPLC